MLMLKFLIFNFFSEMFREFHESELSQNNGFYAKSVFLSKVT